MPVETLAEMEKAYQRRLQALPPKHQLFVRYYIGCRNQAKAYVQAGYSEQGAAAGASSLIKKDEVSTCIQMGIEVLLKKYEASPERIIEELCSLAFTRVDEIASIEDGKPFMHDFEEVLRENPRALASIEGLETVIDKVGNPVGVKVRQHSKSSALKTLAEIYKLKADMESKQVIITVKIPDELQGIIDARVNQDASPTEADDDAATR